MATCEPLPAVEKGITEAELRIQGLKDSEQYEKCRSAHNGLVKQIEDRIVGQ